MTVRGVGLRVRHLNDGRAFGIQLFEQLHDFSRLIRVKIPCRLVRQQQFWLGN